MGILRAFLTLVFLLAAPVAMAAPYAAMVIDARSGEVLHSRNADTRLHPASLTKMMTLYIAFEAIEHGEISLDTEV
ncbi:D-alanyl-D-alanine carboxypeptidase, partial [Escherichia coli]|nr:D-alanyl-D-alanine carboxypeptidase [Escherichia coli]